jgi:hypothetical protein
VFKKFVADPSKGEVTYGAVLLVQALFSEKHRKTLYALWTVVCTGEKLRRHVKSVALKMSPDGNTELELEHVRSDTVTDGVTAILGFAIRMEESGPNVDREFVLGRLALLCERGVEANLSDHEFSEFKRLGITPPAWFMHT